MSVRPPALGAPSDVYDASFLSRMVAELRAYFERANSPQPLNATTLNLNLNSLPTQAALATLASGDVYVDTTAAYVLKVKP
jgi:hypothetical protein